MCGPKRKEVIGKWIELRDEKPELVLSAIYHRSDRIEENVKAPLVEFTIHKRIHILH
jgi:hypothetical protein